MRLNKRVNSMKKKITTLTTAVVSLAFLAASTEFSVDKAKRVDMTFSVSKSFLSTTAGLALDAGLIADVHDPVKDYVADGKFDSEHNAKITWHHLLNQTSDWSGTLWDRPDWGDRPPRKATWDELRQRKLNEPGTHFKYNDVRVNLLAYCLLQVWRTPLPVILREKIMDPIGASPTWRWHGYENSWVLIDGLKMHPQVRCKSGSRNRTS